MCEKLSCLRLSGETKKPVMLELLNDILPAELTRSSRLAVPPYSGLSLLRGLSRAKTGHLLIRRLFDTSSMVSEL